MFGKGHGHRGHHGHHGHHGHGIAAGLGVAALVNHNHHRHHRHSHLGELLFAGAVVGATMYAVDRHNTKKYRSVCVSTNHVDVNTCHNDYDINYPGQRYLVTIPPGVLPSQNFLVVINNVEYFVPCPRGSRPGEQIIIIVPQPTTVHGTVVPSTQPMYHTPSAPPAPMGYNNIYVITPFDRDTAGRIFHQHVFPPQQHMVLSNATKVLGDICALNPLPLPTIISILRLCDIYQNGLLDEAQFRAAVKLLKTVQEGYPLPPQLPPSLLQ